jgi:hypothetical protein
MNLSSAPRNSPEGDDPGTLRDGEAVGGSGTSIL